jgi:hypothetical protein
MGQAQGRDLKNFLIPPPAREGVRGRGYLNLQITTSFLFIFQEIISKFSWFASI